MTCGRLTAQWHLNLDNSHAMGQQQQGTNRLVDDKEALFTVKSHQVSESRPRNWYVEEHATDMKR